MNLVIVGFSQDVDFKDTSSMIHYLKVKKEDGTEFRLQISEAAVKTLIVEAMSKSQEKDTASAPTQDVPDSDPEVREEEDPDVGQEFGMSLEKTGDPDLDGPDLLTRIPAGARVPPRIVPRELPPPPEDLGEPEPESEDEIPSL